MSDWSTKPRSWSELSTVLVRIKQAVGAGGGSGGGPVAIAGVTGLTAALAGKAASTHAHDIDDVTGLQTALDGKQASGSYAPFSHAHSISDVTGLDTALSGKQDALSSGTSIKTVNGSSLLGTGDVTISGSATIKAATATVPSSNGGRYEHTETIIDGDVSGTSKLTVSLGSMTDADENDPELLDMAGFSCVPGAGVFVVKMAFLTRTSGPIKFNYMIGT